MISNNLLNNGQKKKKAVINEVRRATTSRDRKNPTFLARKKRKLQTGEDGKGAER